MNGGYTLFFNYIAQGAPSRISKAITDSESKEPEGPVDQKMFPQQILGLDEETGLKTDITTRVNEQAFVPITETHFNLDKVLKPTDSEEE